MQENELSKNDQDIFFFKRKAELHHPKVNLGNQLLTILVDSAAKAHLFDTAKDIQQLDIVHLN